MATKFGLLLDRSLGPQVREMDFVNPDIEAKWLIYVRATKANRECCLPSSE